jgi:hypothetical protein
MNRFYPNNDITSNIDKLVLKFCDTSANCDSLKSLHDCMENILNEGYDVCIIDTFSKKPTKINDNSVDRTFGLEFNNNRFRCHFWII